MLAQRGPAKRYVLAGIGLLLVLKVLGPVINLFLANYSSSGAYSIYHVLSSILISGLYILAIGLLIAAAFVGRSPDPTVSPVDKITPASSGNPYLSPPS